MCKDMPVSVKVYYGCPSSALEIRRFIFRPEQHKSGSGIYQALLERIRALFNGLNLRDVHLCWKDDDGDYVVFSSDDELRVAITNTTDNTLRIFIREKELPVRMSGPSGSTSSAQTENNVTSGSVALATASSSSRRTAEQLDRHHRHHCHSSHPRRSGRPDSSPRVKPNSTPVVTRHHRPTHPNVDTVARAMADHLNMDEDVLMVAVDHPPNANVNHTGHHRSTEDNATAAASATSPSGTSAQAGSTGVVCSECKGEGRGVWYRCTVCNDFYLCSECENRGLHDQHIMVRISSTAGNRQHYFR